MAPSRRQNNGRSPLVNPQRQITSFFSKSTSPSPSPSSNLSKSKPKPKRSPSPSPSPSPTTPSPLQSKPKKTLLVIGQIPSPPPSTPTSSYGHEVAHKRIRVYWPLDKSWYEGVVKCLDKESNKHMVQYDDGEEELLDLGKEKIEWVEEETPKIFKRLRRGSSSVIKRVVIEDDDSSDEDWGCKNSEEEEVVDFDLEDDKVSKQKQGLKSESRKRKASGGGNLGSRNKDKSGGKGGVKVSLPVPVKNSECK